jgi:hypothetical protein
MTNEEYEQAMQDFLKQGGEIKQIARGVQSETSTTNFWGAPKKKKKTEEEVLPSGDIDI